MKITLDIAVLRSAMEILCEVVAQKDAIPSLRTVEIAVTETRMRVTGTNLDQTIHCDLVAEIAEPGKAIIPARQLLIVASAIPSGEVQLEQSNSRLMITQGSLEYELACWSEDSFPESPKFGATPIKVESEALKCRLQTA